MAAKIPQNIGREDKLVGPLTLKQFLYILGGSALVFVAYQAYAVGYLFYHEFFIVSFIAAALAVSLAFLTINGRPFTLFVTNLFAFLWTPKARLWKKDNQITAAPAKIAFPAEQDQSLSPQSEGIQRSDLEKLATVLDTGGKMKTDTPLSETHIINTVPESTAQTPEIMEDQLGVEDIWEKTDI